MPSLPQDIVPLSEFSPTEARLTKPTVIPNGRSHAEPSASYVSLSRPWTPGVVSVGNNASRFVDGPRGHYNKERFNPAAPVYPHHPPAIPTDMYPVQVTMAGQRPPSYRSTHHEDKYRPSRHGRPSDYHTNVEVVPARHSAHRRNVSLVKVNM